MNVKLGTGSEHVRGPRAFPATVLATRKVLLPEFNRQEVDLGRLRYFLAVAEELSFSRAARRVSLSQQALSSQIKCLEEEVGCLLFFRTTRRVELSPAGRALLPKARLSLAAASEALASARAAEPEQRYNPWHRGEDEGRHAAGRA